MGKLTLNSVEIGCSFFISLMSSEDFSIDFKGRQFMFINNILINNNKHLN